MSTVANTFNYIRAVGLLIKHFISGKNDSLYNMTYIIMINKIGFTLLFIKDAQAAKIKTAGLKTTTFEIKTN